MREKKKSEDSQNWLSKESIINIHVAFPGFNDLGRGVTAVFLLMDHFLYQFSAFSEKIKKIYRLEFEFFAKCAIEFRSF